MFTRDWMISAAAALLALAPMAAFGEGRFKSYDFSFKGEVTDVITEDLSGDGIDDLIMVRVDKKSVPVSVPLASNSVWAWKPQAPRNAAEISNKSVLFIFLYSAETPIIHFRA